MFVALRDLRFAKGRFALMGSVVLLITLLVTMLSGLTAGLARDGGSAVEGLPADRVAFGTGASADGKPSFSDSRIDQRTLQGWQDVPGVTAEPLGIAMGRLSYGSGGERGAPAAFFGVAPGGKAGGGAPDAGRVVLSKELAAKTGLAAGAKIQVAGHALTVAEVRGDASYSHTPVAWLALADWRAVNPQGGGEAATVLLLRTHGDPGLRAADARLGTTTVALGDARTAIPSFSAENGSLQLMRGFLFAISALVIGAFFTVWTIQRRGDVAVLKALGASTGYLLRDALAQAVLVLLAGAGIGGAIGGLAGAAVAGSVPFVVSAGTTVVPVAVMIVLGAAGAALAIRKITSVDPLTALGAAR
ncbi:FtsX-like permease family protein [Actinomadura verrucosospora]|uniref:ABC transporter substrate-binding protein n=1 Tax=Actinomadura verrucosospora TaxID=46165 RepID=A0A7D4A6L5_ACTVE|nr:ABC transporter permease [Actinomadura verrucosospora]QKG22327.1 ABC transporter substrate-binding protein [Actinomadura verrucosospora]